MPYIVELQRRATLLGCVGAVRLEDGSVVKVHVLDTDWDASGVMADPNNPIIRRAAYLAASDPDFHGSQTEHGRCVDGYYLDQAIEQAPQSGNGGSGEPG